MFMHVDVFLFPCQVSIQYDLTVVDRGLRVLAHKPLWSLLKKKCQIISSLYDSQIQISASSFNMDFKEVICTRALLLRSRRMRCKNSRIHSIIRQRCSGVNITLYCIYKLQIGPNKLFCDYRMPFDTFDKLITIIEPAIIIKTPI